MSARLNFLCVSADTPTQERCEQLSNEFKYEFLKVPGPDEAMDLEGKYDQIQFTVISVQNLKDKADMVGVVQVTRHICKEGFICVVAARRMPQETAAFLKSSGANMVLLENEFFDTSRLEFLASQVIRASFSPVKLNEFPVNSTLDFTLYHLMPLNQKLLPVLPKGSPLTENRLKKMSEVSEVFIRRDEIDRYRQFVELNPDLSGAGLKSRCRAQYLSLCHSHTQLIFLLSDQSEIASYKEGKWLYERCEALAHDLLATLSSVAEAWDVVNNSSLGEFGSVERAPTVASYAGLLSLASSQGESMDVMVAALLSDVGILELSPQITRKIRQTMGTNSLTPEEMADYQKHPLLSVNRCLARKLQIKDEVREMILCTHERADSKGFPESRRLEKIPPGAMLIQFSELVDRKSIVKMGQAKISVKDCRLNLYEAAYKGHDIFSLGFLQKIKPVL